MLVDITPPNIKLGRHVLDMDSSFTSEIHFTNCTDGIYADWQGVFEDRESGIQHYLISIGTTQGGNIVVVVVHCMLNNDLLTLDDRRGLL